MQRMMRTAFIFSTLSISAASVYAQSTASSPDSTGWMSTLNTIAIGNRVDIVTADEPQRLHGCHLQSFTAEQMVCSRTFGGPRTYPRQEIIALVSSSDRGPTIGALIGVGSGLGAAILGSFVLAATCPVCAAATSLTALALAEVEALIAVFSGDEPQRVLYVAPGQRLTGKLRSLQS